MIKKYAALVSLVLFSILIFSSASYGKSLLELAERYRENISAQGKVIREIRDITDEIGGLVDSIDKMRAQMINSNVRGRWLIYGEAGEKIVESVENAEHSIIILARMFDIQSGERMKKLADILIEKAAAGKEVIFILSERFPINYFHRVNQHAIKYFKNTDVKLKTVSPVGRFNRELKYFPDKEDYTYVNSAITLVDGVNLVAGTYILTDSDLSSGQSNIIQLQGMGVYEKVKPNIDAVFETLDIEWKMNREKAVEALTGNFVHWAPVEDFGFYLGVYGTPVFKEIYDKARYSISLLTDRPGNPTRTGVLGRAVKKLIEQGDGLLEKEVFYERKSGSSTRLNVIDVLIDAGWEAYRFNEDKTQYHRAVLVDDYWFYTGTIELSLIYIQGWHLQSLVTGGSARLGAELKEAIGNWRENAVAVHEKDNRFKYTAPREKLSERQVSAVKFLDNKVMPAFENNDLQAIITILSDASAEMMGRRFLNLINRSDEIGTEYYGEFFERLNLNPDSFSTRDIQKTVSGRKFLLKVAEELIVGSGPAREIFDEELTNYIAEEILDRLDSAYLVEMSGGYRIYNPDFLSVERGFEWTLKLEETDHGWEISLLR